MDAIDTFYYLVAGAAVFALVVLSIFVAGVFLLVRTGLRRRDGLHARSAELGNIAARLAMRFEERAELNALPFLAGTEIYEGTPVYFENLMTGMDGDDRVAVFDLVYSNIVPGGTGSTTSRQTMCAIESGRLALPRFHLRPEGMLEKALRFAGRRDIDFDSHPTFSGAFLLFGDDEAAIRASFGPELLTHFEANARIAVCASGPVLIVWRPRYVARPAEAGSYIQTAKDLSHRFAA
jgi:hypothetical protein